MCLEIINLKNKFFRSSAKARDKEEALYARIGNIERRLEDVSFQLEHQKTLTRELERMTSASLSARLAAVKDRLTGSKFSSDSHQGIFTQSDRRRVVITREDSLASSIVPDDSSIVKFSFFGRKRGNAMHHRRGF